MKNQLALCKLLSDGCFHSGKELGDSLGISAAAVWKLMKKIRAAGVAVDAVTGKGYRFPQPFELLDESLIRVDLGEITSPLEIEVLPSIDSTNRYLAELSKESPKSNGYVVAAETQSAGRGRLQRKWSSPLGGSISFSLYWQFSMPPSELSNLACITGIAIIRALMNYGCVGLSLKWPNDIMRGSQKLGGILIDMRAESGGPCHVVVGVGLNYELSFEQGKAIDQAWVDIMSVCQKSVSRNRLIGGVVHQLINTYTLFDAQSISGLHQEWRVYDGLMDKEVMILLSDGKKLFGIARGVNELGSLLIDIDGCQKAFNYGEVSVRPLNLSQEG